SFEDAIRIAISVGGDSDTLAAITGAIADGYYGVPSWIREKALSYLDDELLAIYNDWQMFLGQDAEVSRFHVLTKYIGIFSELASYVEFISEPEGDDSLSSPFQMSYSDLKDITKLFAEEFLQFLESRLEYQLTSSGSISLSSMHSWEHNSFKYTFSDALNEDQILSLLLDAVKAHKTDKHHLVDMIKDGSLLKLLKKLKTLESKNLPKTVEEVYLTMGGYFGGTEVHHIKFEGDSALLANTLWQDSPIENQYSSEDAKPLLDQFKKLHLDYWKNEYIDSSILDGTHWELAVKYKENRGTLWSGINSYPPDWNNLLTFFGIEPDRDEEDVEDENIEDTIVHE
ncbi:MAG TPA: ADP-ribosylglycohydrolase family protein, partial [Proteiniclasticum sp.]|nr:ADP-ribosylglycohydrolase family protein [Proteiniclasticum sp.]